MSEQINDSEHDRYITTINLPGGFVVPLSPPLRWAVGESLPLRVDAVAGSHGPVTFEGFQWAEL